MNKRKLRISVLIFLALAAAVVALLAWLGLYLNRTLVEQKRLQEGPPSILVGSPRAGESVPPGSTLLAQAEVRGIQPIARIELWFDGEMVHFQTSESPGQTFLVSTFNLKIDAGKHMLFWRAVDRSGLVGQTLPIPVVGELPPGAGAITEVAATEGQSLEDIAEAIGADPGLLDDMNPDLRDEPLPGGTNVNVPAPPAQGADDGLPPPDNVPPPPPPPEPPADVPPQGVIALPVIDLNSLLAGLLSQFPAAPSHLQAGFQNCTVRLIWNDNADNESHFTVWMQPLGGPPIAIANLESRPNTGQTWFEFDSPSFGIYSFWVEAVNGLGGQSSEIQWLAVNDASCGEGIATKLEIEALGMSGFMSGGWSNLYCYLSLEAAPEMRIPEDDSRFLKVDFTGGADIEKWIGGKNRILLPIPADEELSLEGDCWGWIGDTGPFSMGTFRESVPSEHWDNRTLQIHSSNYVIDYRVRPFGRTQAEGVMTYVDYTIPTPYKVVATVKTSNDPTLSESYARYPTITWEWDGDPQKITGFTVYVNGAVAYWLPIGPTTSTTSLPPSDRRASFLLPTSCGGRYEIHITANSDAAQSALSELVTIDQPPCASYAEVYFERFSFSWIDDGEFGDCDTAEVSFQVYVNGKTRWFQEYEDVECNHDYQFSDFTISQSNTVLGDANTFIVPIDLSEPKLEIYVGFTDADRFLVDVPWDADPLCDYKASHKFPAMSEQEWSRFQENFWEPCTFIPGNPVHPPSDMDGRGVITFRVRGLLSPGERR